MVHDKESRNLTEQLANQVEEATKIVSERQPLASSARGKRHRAASPDGPNSVSKWFLGISDDLAHGQGVIVAARWVLIIAGLALVLWHPDAISTLRLEVLLLLLLAIPNFYLHAQVLMRRPVVDAIVYVASAVDLLFITLLLSTQGGITSNIFVFYFPALLALSVAFPTIVTALYGGAVVAIYGLICASTAGAAADSLQTTMTRLLMLIAVAVCGNIYWRIEGERRRTLAEEHRRLRAELRAHSAPPAAA